MKKPRMMVREFTGAARKLRDLADKLDQYALGATPNQKRLRTIAVNSLARMARDLFRKNAAIDPDQLAPRWPFRYNFTDGRGYVVWRDVFNGEDMTCTLEEAMAQHEEAVFVLESSALEYCDFRNGKIATM